MILYKYLFKKRSKITFHKITFHKITFNEKKNSSSSQNSIPLKRTLHKFYSLKYLKCAICKQNNSPPRENFTGGLAVININKLLIGIRLTVFDLSLQNFIFSQNILNLFFFPYNRDPGE